VCVAALVLVLRHPLPAALPAALIAALAERLSWPLDDNFTIPIACAAALTSLDAL
jgi:dolichol kinase